MSMSEHGFDLSLARGLSQLCQGAERGPSDGEVARNKNRGAGCVGLDRKAVVTEEETKPVLKSSLVKSAAALGEGEGRAGCSGSSETITSRSMSCDCDCISGAAAVWRGERGAARERRERKEGRGEG